MDNNKDSGSNLAFWLPGGAVILSLVVSTFALTREPFLELRPTGAQFEAQVPIDARLWQDPFDALQRYRKRAVGLPKPDEPCQAQSPQETGAPGGPPADIIVAMVEGGPYAEEVEMRRQIRYAVLAGLKNSRRVPVDEQHLRCQRVTFSPSRLPAGMQPVIDLPYESFAANPFDPPSGVDEKPRPQARTLLYWIRQDDLGSEPLAALSMLRTALLPIPTPGQGAQSVLKVIGPATSSMLRDMYRDEAMEHASANIEIYSPLATADASMLMRRLQPGKRDTTKEEEFQNSPSLRLPLTVEPMKLLRTISDDGTMTRMLLDELKLRQVNPAAGVQCSPGAIAREGVACEDERRKLGNRIALVSEWDSFYSRALIESFKTMVAEDAGIDDYALQRTPKMVASVDRWVLRFSYLRGLDGRLPEDAPAVANPVDKDTSKASTKIDLSPLERADGNSQLDYLRRLAEQIASTDDQLRRNGESGIGAIGVMGYDTYDKLLVLQALKSRMPGKLFFSTDLDARMLQRGQAQTTRNLILAAPYGLTLTSALQQDVPPFRNSLQSATFVAVMAALSPQEFAAKRQKFDYSRSGLLSPGIYEVGVSGFIALASKASELRVESCSAPGGTGKVRAQDIMGLRCLQDPVAPAYPQATEKLRGKIGYFLSLFWAGPLMVVVLLGAVLLGWWWSGQARDERSRLALGLYLAGGVTLWIAVRFWRVELMWIALVLVVGGLIAAGHHRNSGSVGTANPLASRALYTTVPALVFILALAGAYQIRVLLTEGGRGEPMYLFEGISAWPSMGLRLLAVLVSLAALVWGWRNLCSNQMEIERLFHLTPLRPQLGRSLWRHLPALPRSAGRQLWVRWCKGMGGCLYQILFPLEPQGPAKPSALSERRQISIQRLWSEQCVCGTFGARMFRAALATWIYLVVSSVLFVIWPMESSPIRGQVLLGTYTWLVPLIVFQLLVFWVMDANRLLTRFIRQLKQHQAFWPSKLQDQHQQQFGIRTHACIDEWVDMMLIAQRSAAVSRLVYAPTLVLLLMLASRSSLFDNWPTPPSLVIFYLLTAAMLLASALSLRRAAEKAREIALRRLDDCLLPSSRAAEGDKAINYDAFKVLRERIASLRTGAFSRYSDEPIVRAVLLSLTGIGGSALVDALNYAKF